jgi:hypothetical protein
MRDPLFGIHCGVSGNAASAAAVAILLGFALLSGLLGFFRQHLKSLLKLSSPDFFCFCNVSLE